MILPFLLVHEWWTANVAIVDQTVFDRLKKDIDPKIQNEYLRYIGIDIKDEDELEKANDVFKKIV